MAKKSLKKPSPEKKPEQSSPKVGDLRVWHIPQIPGKAFRVAVNDVREGALVLRVLARYDLFQFENRIKPDYANAGGLERFEQIEDEGPGEWCEWGDDDGNGIDDVTPALLDGQSGDL